MFVCEPVRKVHKRVALFLSIISHSFDHSISFVYFIRLVLIFISSHSFSTSFFLLFCRLLLVNFMWVKENQLTMRSEE